MATEIEGNRAAGPQFALLPRVSVVMPCYNSAATITAAIESVQAQSFAGLELLVVDDGSRDGSADIVAQIASSDPRVVLVRQENAGPSMARNRGIEMSRAPLIALLDSDDLWTPDHLERHVAVMDADATVGLSFSPSQFVDAEGRATGERTRVWARDVTLADVLAGNPTSNCSSLVVRRDVVRDVGMMRADMSYAEDQEWLFRVVASRWRVCGIAEYTVKYRSAAGGLSSDTQRMLAGWTAFLAHARHAAPGRVEPFVAQATWQMRLYLTRQAVRSGQAPHIARGHFLNAMAASPASAARSPLKTLAFAGACLSPALARRAMNLATSVRHG